MAARKRAKSFRERRKLSLAGRKGALEVNGKYREKTRNMIKT
jgi:hypothetical protein